MDKFDYNNFTYIENLDIREYSLFPQSLRLGLKATPESLLFRLLFGTIDIYEGYNDILVQQKISYNKIQDSFIDNLSLNPIKDWLNSDFGINDLDYYFRINNRNKNLYDELLTEFSWYFINKSRENHVGAFLNLYRALEYMSYSFPMVFASKTFNYSNTYDTLKSFFTNKDSGQLKFFNKFIKMLFHEPLLRCPFSIDTFVGDQVLDRKKQKVIERLCIGMDYSDNGSIITIRYSNVLDLMINLRNKYFHFESDNRDNISNISFNGDQFFGSLNDKFANWLSMIFQEILIHGVYKFNLAPFGN
jgi:hypothetical protein